MDPVYLANRIVRDQYLAEDIIHQAFLKIIDNLDKINEINCHKTKGYILVIVENLSIGFYRKRKKMLQEILDREESLLYE